MKVALVTPTFRVDGGVSAHVHRSAAALRAAGHEVLIVADDVPSAAEGLAQPGIGSSERDVPGAERLAVELRDRQIEVVHFHNVDDPDMVKTVGRASATLVSAHGWSGCPSGARYFGSGEECFRAYGPLCVPNMLLRNCDHKRNPRSIPQYYRAGARRLEALRAADMTTAYSTAVAQHLASNGVAPVALIPLLVDIPADVSDMAGAPSVAFVGRLTAVKGAAILLRSASSFRASINICGDGPARAQLERLTDRLGLRQSVTFRGWLAAAEVSAVYDLAHVVAVPSLWPEPFGMVGPEALAHARPVVASCTGGTGDWLHHQSNGLAVRPGDPVALGKAIARLLADPKAARAMGVSGRQSVVQRFAGDAHVAAVEDAYRRAIRIAAKRRVGQ